MANLPPGAAGPREPARLSAAQYGAIAAFRLALRRFLAFSEAAAAAEGLPAQQHQALLVVAARPPDAPASVGEIADALLVAPHTAAELVGRMVEGGLLAKAVSPRDRRRLELTPTERAGAVLGRLTQAHLEELATLEPELVSALRAALEASRPG